MADINIENGRLNEQFFDFEVFPDWWCCVIGKYPKNDNIPETIKDDFIVIRSDTHNAREELLKYMTDREYVNFGYNIKYYDNIILNGVANGFLPKQLKILSDIIINPDTKLMSNEAMRIAPFAKKKYQNFIYQDLFDDNSGSLKEKEACMQLDIRESTIPFDTSDLNEDQKHEIISYCKHDVWATMYFYKRVIKSFVATKLLVGKVFNIPVEVCYKSTNANLSAKALGAIRTSFADADRIDFVIPKELTQYINYSLPGDVVKRLCASPDKFDVKLFGNTVSYANGGIHSIPVKNLQVKSGNGWKLVNVDAASFYPAMMINYNLLSRAVSKPEFFKEMYFARLEFKKVIEPFENKWKNKYDEAPKEEYKHYKYCKDTSQAYKLILNTTYGASGNKYLALYDPYMTTSTCRLGQLLLTALANNIYNQIGKNKIQIVQTNTDGILCYIDESMLDMLNSICDEFTRVTNILLEQENEEIIWQRDVNNYILYKRNGKEKSKGGFFVTDMIQPGYNRTRPLDNYVCRDAVKWHLKEDRDIVEHIYNETDISKFVVTCHKGSFGGILREFRDGRPDEILHKVNRVYASLDRTLGEIKKTKRIHGIVKKYKAPGCPPNCALINEDLSKYNIVDFKDKIDYMWYINNTVELLSDYWCEMQADEIVPIKIYNE